MLHRDELKRLARAIADQLCEGKPDDVKIIVYNLLLEFADEIVRLGIEP